MQCWVQTNPPETSLSREDCETIVANLDASMAILDRHAGRRSLEEIKLRSMLAVLRAEIHRNAKLGIPTHPLVFQPGLKVRPITPASRE